MKAKLIMSHSLSAPELLERLIAFDTTSTKSNLALVDFVCNYLDRPGARIERFFSEDGNKANVLVRFGPEIDGDQGLMLCGHTDVVPAEEKEWRSDPFRLTEDDRAFYGRGTADMKGFLALAIQLAAEMSHSELRSPFAILLTRDEEIGTVGARHFVESWPGASPLPKATVIGEPTSLCVARMHKGHVRVRIATHGVSAHSGYPHLGHNAIEEMGKAVIALTELRRELERERELTSDFFVEVPYVPLNLGTIRGGSAVNVVPDRCVVELGFRPLPKMDSTVVLDRIRATLRRVLSDRVFEMELLNESPAFITDENVPIYRHTCSLVSQTETRTVSFATDAGWLKQLDLDCVIFGPGTIEVAHKPNEWLPKADFFRAAGVLRSLVEKLCLSESPSPQQGNA